MFDKVLIANRGEIACRIARTCRKHGVATVGVYSSADRNAMHVTVMEETVRIGAAPSSESYLNIDALIKVALQTGVEAVHPGYGFLSENALFAEACENAGLVFIGPSPEAIRLMGSKGEAKRIMAEAGVPVLPGDTCIGQDDASLAASAGVVGYPVMVKPVAGGGGRGMRVVTRSDDLAEALKSARREAASSFGDEALLIEKLVERPRHIEVQIFGDTHGNVVHLFERDCSIQRRHQKIVEEAPAPAIDEDVRADLLEASLTAAKAVGYVGAGTVEFLVAADGTLWFMEMNTRLQVEHPVTEQITGIDLVEWQLRVAAGEELPLRQEEILCNGHSIEARLYAEDPANDFAPGFGSVAYLDLPDETDMIRIDSGVRQSDEITVHYDPMVAKIIATGMDRDAACVTMSAALGRVRIAGPAANEKFLKAIVDHSEFRGGAVDTGFIDRHMSDLKEIEEPFSSELIILAALSELSRSTGSGDPSPWAQSFGWRLGAQSRKKVTFVVDGTQQTFVISPNGLTNNGLPTDSSGGWISDTKFEAVIEGKEFTADVIKHGFIVTVFSETGYLKLVIDDPLYQAAGVVNDDGSLFAHMPGVVVAVHVEDGVDVKVGTRLMVIEAMKVEHTIRAPFDGKVLSVNFAVGDRVTEGAELVFLGPG